MDCLKWFVFLWIKNSKKNNRKIEDDDIKRQGLMPNIECEDIEIPSKTE